MGIKIGNLDLSNIYVGNSQVSKVYVGNVLKWESYNPLKLSGQWRIGDCVYLPYDPSTLVFNITQNINFTSNSQSFSSITLMCESETVSSEDGDYQQYNLTIKYGNTVIGQGVGSIGESLTTFNITYTNDNYKVIDFGSGKIVSQTFIEKFRIPQNNDGSLDGAYPNGLALPRAHFTIAGITFNSNKVFASGSNTGLGTKSDLTNFGNQFISIILNKYGLWFSSSGILGSGIIGITYNTFDWILPNITYHFYSSLDGGITRHEFSSVTSSYNFLSSHYYDDDSKIPCHAFGITDMEEVIYSEWGNNMKIYVEAVITDTNGVFYPETINAELTCPIRSLDDENLSVDNNNVSYLTTSNAKGFYFKQKIADTSSNYVDAPFFYIKNNLIDDLFPEAGTYQYYLQIRTYQNDSNIVWSGSPTIPYITSAKTYTKTTNSIATHIFNSSSGDYIGNFTIFGYMGSSGTASIYAIPWADGDDYSKKVLMSQFNIDEMTGQTVSVQNWGGSYSHIFIESTCDYILKNISWNGGATNVGGISLGINCRGQNGSLTNTSSSNNPATGSNYITSLHSNVAAISGLLGLQKYESGMAKTTAIPIIYPSGNLYGVLSVGDTSVTTNRAVFLHPAGQTGINQTGSTYILGRGKNKATKTWYVWTDNEEIKTACSASADSYTTVTVKHLDGTDWS